jgi:hypothetical protein
MIESSKWSESEPVKVETYLVYMICTCGCRMKYLHSNAATGEYYYQCSGSTCIETVTSRLDYPRVEYREVTNG